MEQTHDVRPTCPYSHPLDTKPRLPLHDSYLQILETTEGVVEVTRANGHAEPGQRVWLVTRRDDVDRVFRDQGVFSRQHADGILGYPPVAGTLLGVDSEEHLELRGLVAHAFTKSATDRQRASIERLAGRLLDDLAAGPRPAELFGGYALPLGLGVIGEVLGVPAQDRDQFADWGNAFLGTGDPEAGQDAQMQMWVYLAGQLEQRRHNPTPDLMTDIVTRAPADMPPEKLVNLPLAIFVAGWETTASLTTLMTLWLLTHPYGQEQTAYRHLVANPDQVPGAVWELLRVCHVDAGDQLPRRVMQDVVLGGEQLRAGDIVLPANSAAGFDPTAFPDPQRVDFSRTPNQHRAFGYGPHHCLGALLAQAELEVAISALVARFPTLRLATTPEDIEWKAGVAVRGPSKMLVEWD